MKNTNVLAAAAIMWLNAICCMSQGIKAEINESTGAIEAIKIENDQTNMNWLVRTDGQQYKWVGPEYGWGLGYFSMSREFTRSKHEWKKPKHISTDGMDVTYEENDIEIHVARKYDKGDLIEEYTLTNMGGGNAILYDIGIYTPFNDNYPDAETCMNARTHAHIWNGQSDAYVNALRMSGKGPHLGLALTEGRIENYEIWERGLEKGNSQCRGIMALNITDLILGPGNSYKFSWRLFSHKGNSDFKKKLIKYGECIASSSRYVYEVGEKAVVELQGCPASEKCTVTKNGENVKSAFKDGKWTAETVMDTPGDCTFEFKYGNRCTQVNCMVVENIDSLIARRIDFIRTRQQMNDKNDSRYGAFMVYDNETSKIYLNDTPNCNPPDRDEGGERVGMGILLAKQYLMTHDPVLKESVVRYADFIRNKLQTDDFRTFSSVDKKGRNRGYNYMWIAEFYFHMYNITNDKKYAEYGYKTLKSMYRQFGYGFYAIGIPVSIGLETLKKAGMNAEMEDLKNDFIKTGDIFIANGLRYPKHEVNYEQSIVAPAILFLEQLYKETGIKKYLDEAIRQLPVLEAFNGFQPSYHLNDIAIRHWDGYWFGKKEMFGDTFPHYWSTITAAAFHYHYLNTGNDEYQKRAENIVRNNLCLFTPFGDGKASCAYIYPKTVNGTKGRFYDPYANDQDWALVFYMLVNKGI